MTYNEWKEELKNNLLSVSEGERRRVLEYYAEAYADRREAGFSEAQIIEEFGAPYDAAQRILSEIRPETTSVVAAGTSADTQVSGNTPANNNDVNVKAALQGASATPSHVNGGAPAVPKNNNKRTIIIIASVLGALFLATVLCFIVGLAVSWRFNVEYTQKEYICEGDISALYIESTMGEIDIRFCDGDKVCVQYPFATKHSVEVEERDGSLVVMGPQQSFPFGGVINIPDTIILLPKDKTIDLNLQANAGIINVGDGNFGKGYFEVNAGVIQLGKISCTSAKIEINAGSLEIENLVCTKVSADLAAGSVVASISSKETKLELSAGSADIKMAGKREEYTIFVEKTVGACNVSKQNGTTDKVLDIDVTTGSVEISFEE